MPTRWLKLTVAYDGGAYAGWQIQPDKPTVQGVFEATWQRLTQESLRVTAAGRTDAGVHALGQVVGLSTETRLDNHELQRGLNALLPEDIRVLVLDNAADGFHATYDAIGKTYTYHIDNYAGCQLPFARCYEWHYPQPLDAMVMHEAGQVLVGRHDFSSFESAGSERPDSVRTIRKLSVTRGGNEKEDHIWVTVTGDGFLYNMVRTIVGSLVEVGTGKRDAAWLADVLAARDRRRAGQTAPPHGLFLVSVDYK
jgi:tRNA pseudouridine38-40 synthase